MFLLFRHTKAFLWWLGNHFWQFLALLKTKEKGWLTIYVYKASWMGCQKFGEIVNVLVHKCKLGGGLVVINLEKIVNINCERPQN